MMTPEQLRAWREAKQWTQEQAAEALGYKRRGYQALESATRPITRTIELAVIGCDAARQPAKSLNGLTLGDLSDPENVRQFEHEYQRAVTDAQMADVGRRWFDSAIRSLSESNQEEIDDLEAELLRAETKIVDLTGAADRLIKALDKTETLTPEIDDAIGVLEAAL